MAPKYVYPLYILLPLESQPSNNPHSHPHHNSNSNLPTPHHPRIAGVVVGPIFLLGLVGLGVWFV